MVAALDSIVNSINETVRKYCANDSETSPGIEGPRTTSTSDPIPGPSSTASIRSSTVSRLRPDISASPCSSATLERSFSQLNSSSKASEISDDAGEVSFASLARQASTLTSPDHRPTVVSRPVSVDVGVQVNPEDFTSDDVTANDGRAEIGIQAGEDDLLGDVRCCPYCHNELPPGDVGSTKKAEMHPSNVVVASSEDNRTDPLSGTDFLTASSSSVAMVTSPASLPSFVQCTLSLGDSFHYSPMRSSSSVANATTTSSVDTATAMPSVDTILATSSVDTAPVTVYTLNTLCNSSQHEVASPLPASAVLACNLSMNTSLTGNGLGLADAHGGQNGCMMHSDEFVSLPCAHSQSPSESSLINSPAVTFSVLPEAARLPMSADSGGMLSNTSLSNITLSDLLPSVQGSIPLELLVNQTDGFTMYTEIVPVSEPYHVDPLSISGCAGVDISDVAVSHVPSPTRLVSEQSPVNMMVCLPISSVSSPSLSSFLSQHRSLSSFAGDAAGAAASEALAAGDTIEPVAIAMVPTVEDGPPKPAENYSIHRIVETSALKCAGGLADCSWSSSNTGVLISRRDIAANSAALYDSSVAEGDDHQQPPDNDCRANVDNGYHDDHSFHDNSCHGDDDSDTHDDVCVIDSDRDVIVIDGDDEVHRPHVGSDAVAATVPERASRVGRHGRRRRRQTTKHSDANRLSRRAATSSTTVDIDSIDNSASPNCLDNGFVELSPSAAVTADIQQRSQPEIYTEVI